MTEPHPPHNFEIEMGLLAAMLANNRVFDMVSEISAPEHFADDRHGMVYEAIGTLVYSGKQANAATLKNFFEANGALAQIGGVEYLARLQAAAVTFINVQDYAYRLRDLWQRRAMMEIGKSITNDAATKFSLNETADVMLDAALLELEEVRSKDPKASTSIFAAVSEAERMADEAVKRGGKLVGIPTGFVDLDRQIGGFEPGQLIVIAGRPSMGKSSLALWMAYNMARWCRENAVPWDKHAKPGAGVHFDSLEMSALEFGYRLIGPLAGVKPFDMRVGNLHPTAFSDINIAKERIRTLNLQIDETAAQTVMGIKARARAMKRRKGLAAVIIDHIGLMQASRDAFRQGGRVAVISEITAGLKQMAKELGVPVIALSQLSRQVEQREDKRPMLSDLRDSGTIEQDADVVIFCYRDSYYLERTEPKTKHPNESDAKFNERVQNWTEASEAARNVAEVIVAKQRNGPVGTVRMHFDQDMSRFSDLAKDAA